MTSIRQAKWARAKAYVLAHPDQSKEEQAVGCDVSITTIANVRSACVRDGLMQPSRKARQAGIAPPRRPGELTPSMALPAENSPPFSGTDEPTSEGVPNPKKPSGMLDHDALVALADMTDLEGDKLSEDEVQKKLLKQCLRFAFDPRLHPDTRMSASQMWAKLKEMAKAKNLGPGKPVIYEDGCERLADMMAACGPQMTMDSIKIAFEVRPNAGVVPNEHDQDAQGPPLAAAAPGSDAPVSPHAGATGPE